MVTSQDPFDDVRVDGKQAREILGLMPQKEVAKLMTNDPDPTATRYAGW
ncbi:putative protein without homology [Propionibacterium freudenreichii subsp. shermanii]|nr:putative protein without homology [Propionibacterium freudenreichii subsp. shermanii]